MIHGHKKSKKQKNQKEQKEQAQLSLKINNKLSQFFSIPRKQINHTQIPKYLQFISLLMQLCTDIPTIFNFRRQLIIKSTQTLPQQQIKQLLSSQIKLTTKLIQSDPKSYTIWSYRQWLVLTLFSINPNVIKTQMELIKMLLLKDEKNFHVWNYRNWLNSIQANIEQDLKFTSEKIKSNPFNFSPYHFRTKFIHQKSQKLLKQTLSTQESKQIITYGMPKQLLDNEFQNIKTAIFLNPNEQAPWLYYNWLLNQLIPAFIVHYQIKQDRVIIYFNMKVNDFSHFIEGDFQKIKGKSDKIYTDTWQIYTTNTSLKIRSNLLQYKSIKLQSTSKLFLGNQVDHNWIEQYIKSILKRQLDFIEQVIQSQQKPCRFAYLQKASIYKLFLQLGTTIKQYQCIVQNGLNCLRSIENQNKARKYTLKQIDYWIRLKKQELTIIEKALKNRQI